MEQLVWSISLVTERKDGRRIIVVCAAVLVVLLIIFESKNAFTGGAFILATLGSFLSGINVALAYTYLRLREKDIVRDGHDNSIGLLRTGISIGGSACGIALLSVILGFLGFSNMLSKLPYQGQEIGHIGLIILLIATYALARKVSSSKIC